MEAGTIIKAINNFLSQYGFYVVTTSILFPFYIHVPILLLAFIFLLFAKRGMLINTITRYPWISIFIIYNLLVSLLDANFIGALLSAAYFFLVIYFSSFLSWINQDKYVQHLKIIALGSIPVAFVAFYDYNHYVFNNGYDLAYIFKYANIQTRAEATFFNANYYGLFCVFALIITAYLLIKTQPQIKERLLYFLAILVNLLAIVLTASRILIPVLAACLLWFVFWTKRKYSIPFFVLIGLGLMALFIFPELMPRLTSLAYAFEDRFAIWNVGWQIFMRKPLIGSGSLSYQNLFHYYTDKADIHAHQLTLNTLQDFGIIGTLILLIGMKSFFTSLIKIWKNKDLRKEFTLISTMILAVLVHGLVDVSIYWTQTAYVFLLTVLPVFVMHDNKFPFKKGKHHSA